jgi:hypothetical protein
MIVKENQAGLRALLELLFAPSFVVATREASVTTREVGHGRIERRRLTTSRALAGRSEWPGLEQVFQLERQTLCKKTGEQWVEVVYGISSLPPQEAGPARLLRLVRGHWKIENRSHWVRDVTFDEDRSQVRCGSIPQVMAALRNTAIGLMRRAGQKNIAAAGRYYAARPHAALALLGIATEN